jgi:UDP-N-acetylmuramoylalanine--D-glutamate ligase
VIRHQVRAVILLDGSGTERLENALDYAGSKDLLVGRFDTLVAAVRRAAEIARRGEVVLFSPGSASFGMFANEFERGEEFKRLVNEDWSKHVAARR